VRITKQKKIIVSVLSKREDHPTATELYSEVKEIIPKISLGTVYRNLDLLTKKGMIQVIDVAGKEKRYDPKKEKHYHFKCLSCGALEDIPVAIKPPEVDIHDAWFDGRVVEGFTLEMIGLCPDCAAKRSDSGDA